MTHHNTKGSVQAYSLSVNRTQMIQNKENDKRNTLNLRFPIVKIPKKYLVKYKDGRKKEFEVKYAAMGVRTRYAEVSAPDGNKYPVIQYDPAPDQVYCIPLDGYDEDTCHDAPYFDPIIPKKENYDIAKKKYRSE